MELECAVCGATLPISTALSWQCPNVSSNSRQHVLHFRDDVAAHVVHDEQNPYLAYRSLTAIDVFGDAIGLDDHVRCRIITDADVEVAKVAGTGFRVTPLERVNRLSDALGFSDTGGIRVKNDTGNVAGFSHKARHLFGILLHLLMGEEAGVVPWARGSRPPLAIASCGNAAIAAATLARSADWPIRVFVPVEAGREVLDVISSLGADIVECPRRADDPPGDPCIHRFREAVSGGAIPFSVQGTENAWCLDGGRTIGWELASQASAVFGGVSFDRVFVQVGGGAFVSCVGEGLLTFGHRPRIHAVQTEGCAPLGRAWDEAKRRGVLHDVEHHWSECMWPWEETPHSLADGILDDETYDWLSAVDVMKKTDGHPVVATEDEVRTAYAMAHDLTDIDVSPTGSAGLARLLKMRADIGDDERLAVMFSGVRRN